MGVQIDEPGSHDAPGDIADLGARQVGAELDDASVLETNVHHAVDLNSFLGYAPAIDRTTGVRAQNVTDPTCIYDAQTQRFYLVVLTLLSWLGSFEGTGRLPAPYDTITVGVVSLGIFLWAVRSGVAHVRGTPASEIQASSDGQV